MISSAPMDSLYKWLLLPVLFACSPLWAEPMVLTAAEWAQPRNGAALVNHPALSASVHRLIEQPDSRLLLRYPGGDVGKLWVHELKAWLVALGVDSSIIEMRPGGELGQISFHIEDSSRVVPAR